VFYGVIKAIGVAVVTLGVFGGLHVAFCATGNNIGAPALAQALVVGS